MRASGAGAAALRHKVAFDRPVAVPDALGGKSVTWSEAHVTGAEIIFQKGGEAVQAARLAGRQVFKIKIRTCEDARAIGVGYRMRDVRRGLPSGVDGDTLPGTRYNVVDVDAITDRAWVWLQVEGVVVI